MAHDGNDVVQPREMPVHHADNFNRGDLYQGMAGGAGAGSGRGDNAAFGHAPGGDGGGQMAHIDFSKAGDIYGGRAGQGMRGDGAVGGTGPSMQGGDRPPTHEIGLSGQRQSDGTTREQNQGGGEHGGEHGGTGHGSGENQNGPGRFGMGTPRPEQRPDMPKDGTIKPNGNESGREISPYDMMRDRSNQGQITDDGRPVPESPRGSAETGERQGHDRILTSRENGKTNEVSSYNANENKLTNYKLDGDGNVSSRTVNDLNDGSTDTVKYGDTGHAESHQKAAAGEAPRDMPIDEKDTAYTTKNPDGSLKSLDTNSSNGRDSISFGYGDQPIGKDSDRGTQDGSVHTHQGIDRNGNAISTQTQNYDTEGKMRSENLRDSSGTTSRTYDENGRLSHENSQNGYRTTSTDYKADRTESTTSYTDGKREFAVTKSDGSSAQFTDDPAQHSSGANVHTADGTWYQSSNDRTHSNERVTDGASGQWVSKNTDNRSGIVLKSTGKGNQTHETYQEIAH